MGHRSLASIQGSSSVSKQVKGILKEQFDFYIGAIPFQTDRVLSIFYWLVTIKNQDNGSYHNQVDFVGINQKGYMATVQFVWTGK